MQMATQLSDTKRLDALGIFLSVLCAIHCLSVPLLLGALPLFGLDFVANHEFEWVMMGLIFAVAGVSYVNGYRRHGRKEVFWFLLAGVLVFALVRPFLPETLHPVATIAGGLTFIAGHWKNWHWHRPSCPKPCCAHSHSA